MNKKPNRLEVMASDLRKMREALESLKESGMNMTLLVMFLEEETGLARKTIESVLAAQSRFIETAFDTVEEEE